MHEVCTYLVLESSMYVLTFTCGLCRSIFHGFFLGPPVCFQKKNAWSCLHFCIVFPKPRFLARKRAPKSTFFGTKENTKKHDFLHGWEHQKARSRPRFPDKGKHCTKESNKNHFFCTKEDTKKHDLEHDFWHEGEHQKAQCFKRKAPKSTIFARCKKERTKKIQKAQFVAWRRTSKSTI